MSHKLSDELDDDLERGKRLGREAANRLINHNNDNSNANDGSDNGEKQHPQESTGDSKDGPTSEKGQGESTTGNGKEDLSDAFDDLLRDSTADKSLDAAGDIDSAFNGNAERSMGGVNGNDAGDSMGSSSPDGPNGAGSEGGGTIGEEGGGANAANSGNAAGGAAAGEGEGAAAGAAGAASSGEAAGAAGATAAGEGTAAASGSAAAAEGGAAASGVGTVAGLAGCGIVALICFIVVLLIGIVMIVTGLFCNYTYSDKSVLKANEDGTVKSVSVNADVTSFVNVRAKAGINEDIIGRLYAGDTVQYTYLGEKVVKSATWYKIQYSATEVGWVHSSYAHMISNGSGGNRMVELANSVLGYIAQNYQITIDTAKADVQTKNSVYEGDGNIVLRGTNEQGGPKGETAVSSSRMAYRQYEYYINDSGLTEMYSNTENGSFSVDVPYILAAISYAFERDERFVDLNTADTDEVWAEVEKILDKIFEDAHTFDCEVTSYSYKVPNPDYNTIIDWQDNYVWDDEEECYVNEPIPIYDNRQYVTKNGNYYTYNIMQNSFLDAILTELDIHEDDEIELVQTKSTAMAELLKELGGLTFPSTDSVMGENSDYGEAAVDVTLRAGAKFAWPFATKYRISSKYGYRTHPVTGAVNSFHKGIDIAAPMGQPVAAARDGQVIKINRSCSHNSHSCGCGGGYGNYVFIKHSDGYVTRYCHLKSVSVSVGQKVTTGQVIGRVGSTGRSTGAHLHFEIRTPNGSTVNPTNYF